MGSTTLQMHCTSCVVQCERLNAVGYDIMSGDFVNMIRSGVIDPAKVTCGALENAASIAVVILTVGALESDLPEDGFNSSMPPGSMGSMNE